MEISIFPVMKKEKLGADSKTTTNSKTRSSATVTKMVWHLCSEMGVEGAEHARCPENPTR
jgi:hypothetical protein